MSEQSELTLCIHYFYNVRAKDSCSVKLAVEEDNILCIVIAVSSCVNSVVGV